MIRYGIQKETDGEITWIAIGTGATDDVQYAHLYTTEELALAKIKTEIKAHQSWVKHTGKSLKYKIVEFYIEARGGRWIS